MSFLMRTHQHQRLERIHAENSLGDSGYQLHGLNLNDLDLGNSVGHRAVQSTLTCVVLM